MTRAYFKATLSSLTCPFTGESNNIGMPIIRYANIGLTSENFELFLVLFPLWNIALVIPPSLFESIKKTQNHEIIFLNKIKLGITLYDIMFSWQSEGMMLEHMYVQNMHEQTISEQKLLLLGSSEN